MLYVKKQNSLLSILKDIDNRIHYLKGRGWGEILKFHWNFNRIVQKIERKTYSLLVTRSYLVKVFRFQRKTLLFLLCFFSSIIIIIFFFSHVFSKTLQPILIKLSDLVNDNICKKSTWDFFGRHFRSRDIKDFMFLLVHEFSPKVFKIELSNFQRL